MKYYQEVYLDQALKELGLIKPITINHKKGVSTVQFELIFPISLIAICRNMWQENRDKEYFFQGTVSNERFWINNIPGAVIVKTLNGRSRNREEPDLEYYQRMASSRFVLCPVGDCQWTYRFFEAIMCGAIPVVNHTPHEQELKFHFLQMGEQPHLYDLAKTKSNLDLLISNHTLQPNKKI